MKFAYDIIKKPVITERSMMGAQDNKYTFEVAVDAGKIEIKKAVEEIFGVKVAKVKTIKLPGTWKRMYRRDSVPPIYEKSSFETFFDTPLSNGIHSRPRRHGAGSGVKVRQSRTFTNTPAG